MYFTSKAWGVVVQVSRARGSCLYARLEFQVELEFRNVSFLRREEKPEYPEKNPRSKDED